MTDDIMQDIKDAMNPPDDTIIEETTLEETNEPEADKPTRARSEDGKFAKKPEELTEEPAEELPLEPVKAKVEAPIAVPAHIKARWAELPEEVQQHFSAREAEIHRMMTAQDGELRIGREMKEVITPYMAIIQSEGGTPQTAVRDLLNTAYQLRTGNPQQKAALLHQVAQQYGVDLNAYIPGQQIDPNIAAMQKQIQDLSRLADPVAIENRLQERMDMARITSEVDTFRANPNNVHFDQVRASMAPLLSSGQAKDMQDAYDQACWANPVIRSTMLAKQQTAEAAKRKTENEAKRRAGASVAGSQSGASPVAKAPTNSIEDDIRSAMRESSGAI